MAKKKKMLVYPGSSYNQELPCNLISECIFVFTIILLPIDNIKMHYSRLIS